MDKIHIPSIIAAVVSNVLGAFSLCGCVADVKNLFFFKVCGYVAQQYEGDI